MRESFEATRAEDYGLNEQELVQFPPELHKYVPEVKGFIENHKYVLSTIAGDSSLKFEPGHGFVFYPKEGKINLGVQDWQWAEELGLEQEQILWSTLHEVAHFQDLAQDPKGMLGLFDYLEENAKKMAPKVLKMWKKKLGELPNHITEKRSVDPSDPSKKMSPVEIFLYQSYHRLYNCLDDIYVNQLVGVRSAPFGPGGSQEEKIKELYRDFLFPTHTEETENPTTGRKEKKPVFGKPPEEGQAIDYTAIAKSHQFTDYLLRKFMVPDQEITVSPEVLEALEQPTDKVLKKNVEQEVAMIAKPSGKFDRVQHTAGWRYKQIQKNIEPIFTKLLMQDIEELPSPFSPPKQKNPKNPENEPQEFAWQPGMKVKDVKTGRKGIIKQINPDGSVVVDFAEAKNQDIVE